MSISFNAQEWRMIHPLALSTYPSAQQFWHRVTYITKHGIALPECIPWSRRSWADSAASAAANLIWLGGVFEFDELDMRMTSSMQASSASLGAGLFGTSDMSIGPCFARSGLPRSR